MDSDFDVVVVVVSISELLFLDVCVKVLWVGFEVVMLLKVGVVILDGY